MADMQKLHGLRWWVKPKPADGLCELANELCVEAATMEALRIVWALLLTLYDVNKQCVSGLDPPTRGFTNSRTQTGVDISAHQSQSAPFYH